MNKKSVLLSVFGVGLLVIGFILILMKSASTVGDLAKIGEGDLFGLAGVMLLIGMLLAVVGLTNLDSEE